MALTGRTTVTSSDSSEWHIERAYVRLSAARDLLNADKLEDAYNRMYYACYEAAHAALSSVGVDAVRGHQGLGFVFGEKVVKPLGLPSEMLRTFQRTLHSRMLADYKGIGTPSKEEVEEEFGQVAELVEGVRRACVPNFPPPGS